MNESDSDRMVESLSGRDWSRTPHPEDADLILLNTCSVREKAEQKLLSALGRYREHKARRGALIAVGGCVAQQEKEALLRRVPYVDFVFGPDHVGRLPELVARADARERFVETGWMDSEEYVFPRADAEAARVYAVDLLGMLRARGVDVPVRLVDERLSTAEAARGLQAAGRDSRSGRSVIDQAAAVIIVQHALDSERSTGSPPGTVLDPPEDSA